MGTGDAVTHGSVWQVPTPCLVVVSAFLIVVRRGLNTLPVHLAEALPLTLWLHLFLATAWTIQFQRSRAQNVCRRCREDAEIPTVSRKIRTRLGDRILQSI